MFLLAFTQFARTGRRNAVLGQQPKDVVALLSVSPHHYAHGDAIQLLQTPLIESINLGYCAKTFNIASSGVRLRVLLLYASFHTFDFLSAVLLTSVRRFYFLKISHSQY